MPGAGEAGEKQKNVFGVFWGLWDYFPWEFHFTHTNGSAVKDPPANAADVNSIPGMGRSPREGNGNPLQYYCHGQRTPVGYSPRGRKESDMT